MSAVNVKALLAMADALETHAAEILSANAKDVENAKNTLSPVMIDRLRLDEKRIFAMAQGIREVAALPDPVGTVLEQTTLPNGLLVTKKRVPLGAVGIIYESRPNVTSDAGALCFKSGNVCRRYQILGGDHIIRHIRQRCNVYFLNLFGLYIARIPIDTAQLVPPFKKAVTIRITFQ